MYETGLCRYFLASVQKWGIAFLASSVLDKSEEKYMCFISTVLVVEKKQDGKLKQWKFKLLVFIEYEFLFNTVFQGFLY